MTGKKEIKNRRNAFKVQTYAHREKRTGCDELVPHGQSCRQSESSRVSSSSQVILMCLEAVGHSKSPIFSGDGFRALIRTVCSA